MAREGNDAAVDLARQRLEAAVRSEQDAKLKFVASLEQPRPAGSGPKDAPTRPQPSARSFPPDRIPSNDAWNPKNAPWFLEVVAQQASREREVATQVLETVTQWSDQVESVVRRGGRLAWGAAREPAR